MKKILWLLIIIPLICVLCVLLTWGVDTYLRWSRANYTTEESLMVEDGWERGHLPAGGAFHLDGFSIAYFSMEWERYPDENGVMKRGQVVYLDMWTAEPNADRPTDEQIIGLHKGQEVSFSGYRIKVIDIEMEGGLFSGHYVVDLAVKPPETQ